MSTVRRMVVVAGLIGLSTGLAYAQAGGGMGQGPGPMGAGTAASSAAPGMGMGPGAGRGAARWGSGYTPGWTLMTAAERKAHQEHMRGMKTYDECTAYRDQQHELMVARAKESGKTLAQPRRDACSGLK